MNLHLPGADVTLHADFLPRDEADTLLRTLIETLPWQQRDVTVQGRSYPQPRLTAWFGDAGAYTYSGLTLEAEPWTPELARLRDLIEERTGVRHNSVLANHYRAGRRDSIGMHSDDEVELGRDPEIASVSLGEERPFVLAPKPWIKAERTEIPLPHGSLLVMRGQTQRNWRHGVDKPSMPSKASRVNLTFRTIRR